MNINGMNTYEIQLGSKVIFLSLLYPETYTLFDSIDECEFDRIPDISLDTAYLKKNEWLVTMPARNEELEYHCLMLACGNHILQYQHALFHGACFLWKGKAWIFTAPSGTGKTTQLRNWIRLWRQEVTVVNGDKPVIECRDDGSVWAYSSPWKGKERIGRPGLSAPLGGIILLEQGKDNTISRMTVRDTVSPLFCEFVSMPETVEQLGYQGKILDQMLEKTPVWKLVNTGNTDSAVLTRKTLEEYLETLQ